MKYLVAFIFFAIAFSSFAQEVKKEGYSYKNTHIENILYWKTTDQLVTLEEMAKISEEFPKFTVEAVYNKYGQVEKYYFDPNNPYVSTTRKVELQPKMEEEFPEFFFETLNGEKFDKENMKGKWILLYFRHSIRNMNSKQFEEIHTEVLEAKKVTEIEAFAVFSYDENLESLLGAYQPDIHLVNNGVGFFQLFQLVAMPTSFLINPEGILVAKFQGMEKVQILDYLK
ncbi:TlpA family protein disulfide reductase [Algoriphagus taiwanensis]|uniref:Uncharacterized protein n=1 Tax=Algoriphagus taiwanensis TaxID=1445656 RepID=A0ABQ6Q377_9BACT|nr:hypothetical protein Ataiwa_17290 [Algoriphagus taiwanensis]